MPGRGLLAALAAAVVLASCIPETEGPGRADPSPTEVENAAAGHLRFGVLGDVATLDPYSPKATDLTFALVRPVYPSLFRLEADGSVVNSLAAEIEVSGRKAVVTLAKMSWSHTRQIKARDVVASWRRAGPPSGFSRIERARMTGPLEVTFEGNVTDWEAALATNAFILPSGKVGRSYAGPYMIEKRVRGLVVRYGVNPTWEGAEQGFARLSVFSVDTTGELLRLLQREKLDAAWFPSTVNLAERLDAADIRYDSALGWSSVELRAGANVSSAALRTIGGALDRRALDEAFIRDDGRVSDTLVPGPGEDGVEGPFRPGSGGGSTSFTLAAPHGDELLEFLQRAIQLQLAKAGFDVETVDLPVKDIYSETFEGVSLLRREGSPEAPDPRAAYSSTIPLFNVKTYVVWNQNLHPLEANPTSEGPLWNVETWSGG